MGDSRITLPFLQTLFKNAHFNVNVESFEETTGSDRGDNYTSSLFRIYVKGHSVYKETTVTVVEPWETWIIYKCLPESSARREAFKSVKLFENELIFYNKVIPLFHKFQETYSENGSNYFNATPTCYLAEEYLIILEDLRFRGYQMANRKQGFTYNQISAVLKELAKFHAISLAMKILMPKEFSELIDEKNGIGEKLFVEENEEWYREYYKHAIKNVVDMIDKSLPEGQEKDTIIEKFSNFADDAFFSKMIILAKSNGVLDVLCHGDCWTNNIMFKTNKETGNLQVYFIDFQLCRYGSLALDLANLIYCCTTRKLRDEYLLHLLRTYTDSLHSCLNDYLQESSAVETHDFLDKEHLHELIVQEFKRCSLFGLGLAIDIIPISTCDSEEAPDMYETGECHEDELELIPVPIANELCSMKMIRLISELIGAGIL